VTRRLFLLALFLFSCTPNLPKVNENALRKIVRYIASDEMKGRRAGSREAHKTAKYIAQMFHLIGLEAPVKGNYLQYFRVGKQICVNVLGLLEGKKQDEIIIIGAHHDGLGINKDLIFNGADDNASGVSMLIELARVLSRVKNKLKRSILFVSFDAEEICYRGSSYFVRSKVYNLENIVAMICLDLIGGSLFEFEKDTLYALGSEYSKELSDLIKDEIVKSDLEIVRLGIYTIEPFGKIIARGDHAPFRDARIPFILFSTGTPWYYHTPYDDPQNLNYKKMSRIARFLAGFIYKLANLPQRPSFMKPETDPSEIKIFKKRLKKILKHKDLLGLKPLDVERLQEFIRELKAMHEPNKRLLQKITSFILTLASKKPGKSLKGLNKN
jgi:hypothetical protein